MLEGETRTSAVLALVDDNAAVRHALTFAFETDGYPVVAFADAESALAAPRLDSWRCMVLDYCLPGMSGLDLLGRVRGLGVVAPAILITTNPNAALRRRARLAGAEIVEKPLLDSALDMRVAHHWFAEHGEV